MFKSLDIQNFQCHKNLHLDFHPGVNIIIGTSDVGKSAIIRSIKWIIDNSPVGNKFINKSANNCIVKLDIDNNLITREKTKDDKVNLYKLNNKEYKAFKTDVPVDIVNILNFDDLNIQYQKQVFFLFDKSPGQIAGYFNNVVNLDIIDNSLSYIESSKRRLKKEVDDYSNKKIELEKSLQSYNWLDEFKQDIDELLILETLINDKQLQLNKIKDSLNVVLSSQKIIENFDNLIISENLIKRILKDEDLLNELNSKRRSLYLLLSQYSDLNGQLSNFNNLLKSESEIKDIYEDYNNLILIKSKKDNLKTILQETYQYFLKLESIDTIIEDTLKKIPDNPCNLCPINNFKKL